MHRLTIAGPVVPPALARIRVHFPASKLAGYYRRVPSGPKSNTTLTATAPTN